MKLLNFYKDRLEKAGIMPSLLAQIGLTPRGGFVRNPTYQDKKPSVYVYKNSVHDYGEGKSYDVLDVAKLWLGLTFEQSIDLLARLAGVDPPIQTNVTVKPIAIPEYQEPPKLDPVAFGDFADQAQCALYESKSRAAEEARAYLDHRGVLQAAYACGVGVADHTITAKFPSLSWRSLLTLPSWAGDSLKGCKARNTASGDARVMRNIAGASVPLYNLENALYLSDAELVVVEGEFDCLSMLEAFELGLPVVGLGGVKNWRKPLESVSLGKRKLILALDGDKAGRETMLEIHRWAKDTGKPSVIVDIGDGDKNDRLKQSGAAGLREEFLTAWDAAERHQAHVVKGALK